MAPLLGQVAAPELTTFGIYLAGMVGIGVWVYNRTRTLGDFILGGRTLSSPVAALSAQASDMSGWLLLGLPGAVYAAGIGASWIAIGLAIGTYLNWKFVAPRLRVYTEAADDAVTLSAYFESRFEDRTRLLRMISAVVIIVFFSIYVASGLVAGGLLFEQVFGIDSTVAITGAALVIVVYTFLGGFLAVSFTDTVQGLLMLVALLVVPIVAISAAGGVGNMVDSLNAESPALLSLFTEASFADGAWSTSGTVSVVAIVSGLAWGLGYFGQPHILARFMGIRSAAAVPSARKIAMVWVILSLLGAVLVGLAAIVDFAEPLGNPEIAFIRLIQEQLNPWIGGFLLAAVLAAIMSTADSQLLVVSAALTEDFYRAVFRRDASESTLVWVGRFAVVGVAIIAYLLALQGGGVLDLVEYAWAGFGAAFGPVILLSLFWPRMTSVGALAGMVVGAVTVVAWRQLAGSDLYEIIPGVILGTIAVLVGSRWGTAPTRRWVGPDTPEEAAAR